MNNDVRTRGLDERHDALSAPVEHSDVEREPDADAAMPLQALMASSMFAPPEQPPPAAEPGPAVAPPAAIQRDDVREEGPPDDAPDASPMEVRADGTRSPAGSDPADDGRGRGARKKRSLLARVSARSKGRDPRRTQKKKGVFRRSLAAAKGLAGAPGADKTGAAKAPPTARKPRRIAGRLRRLGRGANGKPGRPVRNKGARSEGPLGKLKGAAKGRKKGLAGRLPTRAGPEGPEAVGAGPEGAGPEGAGQEGEGSKGGERSGLGQDSEAAAAAAGGAGPASPAAATPAALPFPSAPGALGSAAAPVDAPGAGGTPESAFAQFTASPPSVQAANQPTLGSSVEGARLVDLDAKNAAAPVFVLHVHGARTDGIAQAAPTPDNVLTSELVGTAQPTSDIPLTGAADPAAVQTGAHTQVGALGQGLDAAKAQVASAPAAATLRGSDTQASFTARPVVTPAVPASLRNQGQEKLLAYGLPANVTAHFDAAMAVKLGKSQTVAQANVDKARQTAEDGRNAEIAKAHGQTDAARQSAEQAKNAELARQQSTVEAERAKTFAEMDAQGDAVRAQVDAEAVRADREISTTSASQQQSIESERSKAESAVSAEEGKRDKALDKERKKEAKEAKKKEKAEAKENKKKSKKKKKKKKGNDDGWFAKQLNKIRNAFASAMAAIKQAISAAIAACQKAIAAIMSVVKAVVNAIVDAAVQAVAAIIQQLATVLTNLVNAVLAETFPALAASLTAAIDSAAQAATAAVTAIGEAAKKAVAAACDAAEKAINTLLNVAAATLLMAMAVMEATVTGDWSGVARQGLESALMIVGISPKEFEELIGDGTDTVETILADPGAFIGNLIDGVGQGFQDFASNFGGHVEGGLMTWLTGQASDTGITMPPKLDLMGVLDIVLQVTGIDKEYVLGKCETHLGKENRERIEFAWDFVEGLFSGGLAGLWDAVKDSVGDLWQMFMGTIKDFLMEKVIKAAVIKVMTLFNPVGALVEVVKTAWHLYKFLKERVDKIRAVVQSVIDTLADVASGNLGAVAAGIEGALAGMVPLAIDLLARILGLGDIGKKVAGVIGTVRDKVDKGIEAVIEKVKGLFKPKEETATENVDAEVKDASDADPEHAGQGTPNEDFGVIHFVDDHGGDHELWIEGEDNPVMMVASTGGTIDENAPGAAPISNAAIKSYERYKQTPDPKQKQVFRQQYIDHTKTLTEALKIELAGFTKVSLSGNIPLGNPLLKLTVKGDANVYAGAKNGKHFNKLQLSASLGLKFDLGFFEAGFKVTGSISAEVLGDHSTMTAITLAFDEIGRWYVANEWDDLDGYVAKLKRAVHDARSGGLADFRDLETKYSDTANTFTREAAGVPKKGQFDLQWEDVQDEVVGLHDDIDSIYGDLGANPNKAKQQFSQPRLVNHMQDLGRRTNREPTSASQRRGMAIMGARAYASDLTSKTTLLTSDLQKAKSSAAGNDPNTTFKASVKTELGVGAQLTPNAKADVSAGYVWSISDGSGPEMDTGHKEKWFFSGSVTVGKFAVKVDVEKDPDSEWYSLSISGEGNFPHKPPEEGPTETAQTFFKLLMNRDWKELKDIYSLKKLAAEAVAKDAQKATELKAKPGGTTTVAIDLATAVSFKQMKTRNWSAGLGVTQSALALNAGQLKSSQKVGVMARKSW